MPRTRIRLHKQMYPLFSMNKFEQELGEWADVIQRYCSVTSRIAQRVRRILRKNVDKSEVEEYVQVFGEIHFIETVFY